MGKDLELVAAKIPPSLYKKVQEEIDSSKYINQSDFVRQAVREKLGENGNGFRTIEISIDTHEELMSIGSEGEDFDDVLRWLIENKGE